MVVLIIKYLLIVICNICVITRLKEQQGLLVDFSAFPQKFIDLIDLCSREEESHNPRYDMFHDHWIIFTVVVYICFLMIC